VGEAGDRSIVSPGAALLASVLAGLRAALHPGVVLPAGQVPGLVVRGGGQGGDAGRVPLEDGQVQVQVSVVAAGLVPSRAGVEGVELGGLGGRTVDNPGVNQTLAHQIVHGQEVETFLVSSDAAALLA